MTEDNVIGDNTQIPNPCTDCDTLADAEALSGAAGFPIEDLQSIPFEVQETNYIYLGDGLAEIRYYGAEEESLDYRKATGEEDNSGVYLDFERVQEEEIDGVKVTVKGDEDRIYLILWQKDGFSYSIYDEEGIPAEEVTEWLEGWIQ